MRFVVKPEVIMPIKPTMSLRGPKRKAEFLGISRRKRNDILDQDDYLSDRKPKYRLKPPRFTQRKSSVGMSSGMGHEDQTEVSLNSRRNNISAADSSDSAKKGKFSNLYGRPRNYKHSRNASHQDYSVRSQRPNYSNDLRL